MIARQFAGRVMPQSPLFAEALACHQAGRLDEAGRLYRQLLAADDRHADSLHLLGVIAYQQGSHTDAAALIGQAIALNPKAASYHANLGLVLREQGALEEAAASQRIALSLTPDYPEAHNNLGLVLQDQGKMEGAALCYRRAIALKPDLPEAHNNLANILEEQGRLEDALAHCRKALDIRPYYPEAQNSLGIILAGLGRSDEAAACYRQALAQRPDYAHAWNNLAGTLKNQGQFEDAIAAYQKALALGGDSAAAYYGLASCRKFTAADKRLIGQMKTALERNGPASAAQAPLHFALGKIHDELGDYGRAIGHYDQANALEREKHRFDRQDFGRLIDRLIDAYPRSPSPHASDSQLPLLIVGLPRSGTTLVEQILASHPDIAAGGELSFWPQRSQGIWQDQTSDGAAEQAAIRDYLDLLRDIAPQAARVTDKMPYNFLNVGLVHSLFPKARIIHCRRNPLDTALSIYFSRFARAHAFAYDREDIAFYVDKYQRLTAHWRKIMPPKQYLEVDYEALIANQRTVSQKLVRFCGLKWDKACMEFFRTERTIGTLSAWQARQPLYSSSVERWRNYQPWLGALELLRPR
jgi:tetratricopeptide (TPR) repeat protein